MIQRLADKPSHERIDVWFADLKETADLNPIIKEQRLSLNNLPALRVRYRNPSNGGLEIDTVYVVTGSRTFEISFGGDKPNQGQVEQLRNYPIYLQMLASFKIKN